MLLANRVVVSPMCQYSATDGVPNEWHHVHLGSRAVGGAGLIVTEMTDISPEGRITPGCTGLYNDEQVAAWRRIVDFIHTNSYAKVCVQLAHAGRKASRSCRGKATTSLCPRVAADDRALARSHGTRTARSPRDDA